MDKTLTTSFSLTIPLEFISKVPDDQLPETVLNLVKDYINNCSTVVIYSKTRDRDDNLTHLQFNLF